MIDVIGIADDDNDDKINNSPSLEPPINLPAVNFKVYVFLVV